MDRTTPEDRRGSASPRDLPTPRRRRRVAQRILRLRHDVRRYRLLAQCLGAVAAVCLLVAGVAWTAPEPEPETTDLGRGVAGVERYDPDRTAEESGAVVVELPEGYVPPAPPPEKPAAGEALVRRLLGEGAASYYHDALEGRSTASGQPYRAASLTAAHRSLPFGSRVRVTNLSNGRAVVVRINDRGPFARGRVIDLSRSAASRIGLLARGHGKVRLELVE